MDSKETVRFVLKIHVKGKRVRLKRDDYKGN